MLAGVKGTGLIALACLSLSLALSAAATAAEDAPSLVAALASPDASDRMAAAAVFADEPGPPFFAVPALLAAARVEPEQSVLVKIVIALGRSGVMEALGLIQTHALSPVDAVRSAGRTALRLWLIQNRVLTEDDELPEPPHPFFEPPPRFPADRTAGHSLAVWMGPPGPHLAALTEPPPSYEAVDPDGLPPGYRLGETPRYALLGAGLGVFAGLYLAPVVVASVEASEEDDEFHAELLIPVAGALIRAGDLLDDRGFLSGLSHLAGALLILDALGQTGGIALAIAGGVAKKSYLERAPGPQLTLTPGGATLSGQW
jgi:hypothetical protein